METAPNKILITGIAGFIGFSYAQKVLSEGYEVIGIDNLNDYYDIRLKLDRLSNLGFEREQIEGIFDTRRIQVTRGKQLTFFRTDLEDRESIQEIFSRTKPGTVFNAAAQAGVRYSLKNPYAYIDSNISGFLNILENCRHHEVKHLVYASSSSVYGSNRTLPFSVHQNVDHPVSLYAATKKSNELMAHAYSHLYGLPTTGLRFFTVYGPWGRPDMALYIFTRKILNDEPIEVYNFGEMARDFTYIDDIVEGIHRVMQKIPEPGPMNSNEETDPALSTAPYRIFNIGNNQSVDLLYFIQCIEENLGKEAQKKLLPLQKGDVVKTYADIDDLTGYTGFQPLTSIEEGVRKFIDWYLDYHAAGK